jgi:hydrogenase expression/formation protein HypE
MRSVGTIPESSSRTPPRVGKVDADFFDRSIRPSLGAHRPEVKVPPSPGVDFTTVQLPGGRSLLATTDPLYVEPALGWDRAAWFAFHIVVSDLAMSGLPPDYLLFDLAVPPPTPDVVLRRLLRTFHREARKYRAAIVAGHTGRYEASRFPMVGTGTALAVARPGTFPRPRDVRPGDRLLAAGSPGLEAAILLAHLAPEWVTEAGGSPRQLSRRLDELSVVEPALALAGREGLPSRGIAALHDASEGGLRAAIWELARASRAGVAVDLGRIPADPDLAPIFRRLRTDSFGASSQGTLLVAVRPYRSEEAGERLRRCGLSVTDLGEFTAQQNGCTDRGRPLGPPFSDDFWPAVVRARRRRATR